jgi:hypothetical protein
MKDTPEYWPAQGEAAYRSIPVSSDANHRLGSRFILHCPVANRSGQTAAVREAAAAAVAVGVAEWK